MEEVTSVFYVLAFICSISCFFWPSYKTFGISLAMHVGAAVGGFVCGWNSSAIIFSAALVMVLLNFLRFKSQN